MLLSFLDLINISLLTGYFIIFTMSNLQNTPLNKEDLFLYNTFPRNDDRDSTSKSGDEENEESLQNGRWNSDEHIRFIKGCLLYGNNWKKVIFLFYFYLG